MKTKLIILTALFFLAPFLYGQDIGVTPSNQALNVTTPTYNRELFPNISSKSIMTPIGWGGASTYVFGFLGATVPQPYAKKSDFIAAIGVGTGNAYKAVSIVGILNVPDVSQFDDYSGSFMVSRYLGKGSSISAGALHLFANPRQTDAGESYYVVFSHAVQTLPSAGRSTSKLHYSVGVGNGRFYDKSGKDEATGKGRHGTAVFLNVSYEIFKNFNINAEWTGQNLGFGAGWRPSSRLPAIAIGITDLTRYSGDKPRFVFGIGHAIVL